MIIPRRTNKLDLITIEDGNKILPWKCSKFEMIGPVRKFEVFIDEKWYKLESIDTYDMKSWITKEIHSGSAHDKCNDFVPQN